MKSKTLKFVLFVAILLACWMLGRSFNIDLDHYQAFFSRFPLFLSGIIFVALYIPVTFFVWFGAKDVFRVASALLFGGLVSAILVTIAELGNAVVLFHLSRKLGREYVEERFKLKAADVNKMKKSARGFSAFVLRINPLIPFRLQDLCAGLSSISFKKYFIAIVVGTPGRVFWLQSIIAGTGVSLFKDPLAVQDYLLEHSPIIFYSAFYFLAVFILSVMATVFGFKKK